MLLILRDAFLLHLLIISHNVLISFDDLPVTSWIDVLSYCFVHSMVIAVVKDWYCVPVLDVSRGFNNGLQT